MGKIQIITNMNIKDDMPQTCKHKIYSEDVLLIILF